MQNVERAQPGLKLDGVLVEAMSPRGLELVVGARRDPRWGPVVMVGLGGIWVEALGDVRLMPPDLTEDEIVEELGKLKTAKLLQGFRGSPPVDVKAVAAAAAAVGRLMRARPDIAEVDINPLMVHAAGHGATALDALDHHRRRSGKASLSRFRAGAKAVAPHSIVLQRKFIDVLSELITYELDGAVAVIGLNRPDKRNAINNDVVMQLRDAVVRGGDEADAGVIFGHGVNFSAGLDLAELLKNMDPGDAEAAQKARPRLAHRVRHYCARPDSLCRRTARRGGRRRP